MVNLAVIKTNVGTTTTMTQMIQQSMPDLAVLSPVSGRNLSKVIKMGHPAEIKSSRGPVRFMAHPINLPIIPTEVVGSLNRLVNYIPRTKRRGRQVRTMTRMNLASQTLGDSKNYR